MRYIEDHVIRVPILHCLTIQDGLDRKRVGLEISSVVTRQGPKGAKVSMFCPGSTGFRPFDLPVAGANIVACRIAQNIVQRLRAWNILASLADHNH